MFYKNYYRFKKTIVLSFTILLLIFTCSPFILSAMFLPEKIHIIAGKEEQFDLNVPVFASLTGMNEKVSGIKINHQPIKDNIHINLNEKFSVLSEEEGSVDVMLTLFGVVPLKKMTVSVIPDTEVIPCGITVGVRINTDGIMVLGTGFVNGPGNESLEPAKDILKSGDLIVAVNQRAIENKEQLIKSVKDSNGAPIDFRIKRAEIEMNVTVTPVQSPDDGEYKLGVWVRDSTQGIGTVTYYNPDTMKFGALGHGIMDVDTKQLMSIKNGTIMSSEVASVKKGKKGAPGELIGHINTKDTIGLINTNTAYGIYGYMNQDYDFGPTQKMQIGLQNEVREGTAYILSNVEGHSVKQYEVEIQSINRYSNDDSKGIVIKIIDEELIAKTGGIVQGMSGSPIIQDNKLIGAVTHVFVQDPARGYGIFIENMLKQEENI